MIGLYHPKHISLITLSKLNFMLSTAQNFSVELVASDVCVSSVPVVCNAECAVDELFFRLE